MRKIKNDKLMRMINYHEKELSFGNQNLLDLSNLDLKGIDLSNRDLSFTNFNFSQLNDSNLSHSRIEASSFLRASMRHSNLENIDEICHSKFSQANLSCASLAFSKIRDVDFSEVLFTNANLVGVEIFASNFTKAQLSGINLHWAKGLKFYTAGTINNQQLAYYPEFNITTFGPFQDTWEEMNHLLDNNYAKDNVMLESIHLAENYILEQIKLDD